jgi:hypothetical protein
MDDAQRSLPLQVGSSACHSGFTSSTVSLC